MVKAECWLVLNLLTGMQFLGKESNSHYHAHINCPKKADATFHGHKLMIPLEASEALDMYIII